jgi:hypothetical protein
MPDIRQAVSASSVSLPSGVKITLEIALGFFWSAK